MYKFLILFFVTVFWMYSPKGTQLVSAMKERPFIYSFENCCTQWHAKVDKSLAKESEEFDEKQISEKELMKGIECLLKLEGNKTLTWPVGKTNIQSSQPTGLVQIQVNALYFISYLYYGKWEEADAISLVETNKERDSPETIKRAYESYRTWFEKVKEIGLEKAREQKLDPLDGTDVRWY